MPTLHEMYTHSLALCNWRRARTDQIVASRTLTPLSARTQREMLTSGDAAAALRVLSNSLAVYLPTHQHVALVPYMLIELQDVDGICSKISPAELIFCNIFTKKLVGHFSPIFMQG